MLYCFFLPPVLLLNIVLLLFPHQLYLPWIHIHVFIKINPLSLLRCLLTLILLHPILTTHLTISVPLSLPTLIITSSNDHITWWLTIFCMCSLSVWLHHSCLCHFCLYPLPIVLVGFFIYFYILRVYVVGMYQTWHACIYLIVISVFSFMLLLLCVYPKVVSI